MSCSSTIRVLLHASGKEGQETMEQYLEGARRWIFKVLEVMLALLLAVMVVLVFGNVIGRYFLSRAITWADEMARYMFIWLTFIGAAAGVHRGAHIGLDLLVTHVSERKQEILKIIGTIGVIVFLAVWARWGFRLVWLNRRYISPGVGVSMAYVYGVAPVMAVVMALEQLVSLAESVRKLVRR